MSNIMQQASRFGAIGLLATIIHVVVALALVEFAGLKVFWANIGAFCAAVSVSYLGNHRWTFACQGAHAHHLPRFLAIAALGLAIGQVTALAVVAAGGHHRTAIVMVALMVPAFSFVACRLFVFAKQRDKMEGISR